MGEAEIREHLREALLAAGQTGAVEACETENIDMIVFSQHAFGHSMQDVLALGTLIKYAGAHGKKVMVMVQELRGDRDEDLKETE